MSVVTVSRRRSEVGTAQVEAAAAHWRLLVDHGGGGGGGGGEVRRLQEVLAG